MTSRSPTVILFAPVALLWARAALAQDMPVPPCAGPPEPAAAAVGTLLEQSVWIRDDSPIRWSPPACTGWTTEPITVLLAAAGRFAMPGDTAALAERLGNVSRLAEIIYWSSSRKRWRHLFKETVALSRPDRSARREDFSADDLATGAVLHYWLEEDNPTIGVIYELRVHARTPDRLVFETVNSTPVAAKLLFLRPEVAAPGELRQLYYMEREGAATWRYYTLIRMAGDGSLFGTSAANYRNRTEAYFRFLAGLRMDREPPAAR